MVVPSARAATSRSEGDRILAETLRPTVEDAIRASVQKDPGVMAEALWPVLGPALRQAISRAWREMIEALSAILESALSLRGLRWRWEAFRSGRSLGEIALLHSLIYRVEQIFLIHRKTGLCLLHVADPDVEVKDSAVVAAMWTAIRDFVQDSFGASSENTLDTIRIGELTLWLEPGPRALLAAVIRGQPRPELREVLQDALERIHCDFARELETFEGDSARFAECRSYLERCLEMRQRPPRKPSSAWLLGPVGVVAALFLAVGLSSLQQTRRWHSYISALQSQPGTVVTLAERRDGKYHIRGLLDPLAQDPARILSRMQIDPGQIIATWEPYLSLSSPIVEERARRILRSPQTVTLRLENGVLIAKGTAPHGWIVESRRMAGLLPGVHQFRTEELVAHELEALSARVASLRLQFWPRASVLAPDQAQNLQKVIESIQSLYGMVQSAGIPLRLQIAGHADSSGPDQRNHQLSQERARTVRKALVARGIAEDFLVVVGEGTKRNTRSVSFQAIRAATGPLAGAVTTPVP